MKQQKTNTRPESEREIPKIIVGIFNTYLLVTDRTNKQLMSKYKGQCCYQPRIFCYSQQNIIISIEYENFTKIDHVLEYKANLNTFNNIEIIHSLTMRIKLGINNNKKPIKILKKGY